VGEVVALGTITMDTIAMPCVASLGLQAGQSIIQSVNGVCAPSSGVLPVSGSYGTFYAPFPNSTVSTFANNSSYSMTSARQTNFPANNATFPANTGIVPVSSYQNSIYDNFNRANGSVGANWTTFSTFTGPTITSNQVVGPAGNSGA